MIEPRTFEEIEAESLRDDGPTLAAPNRVEGGTEGGRLLRPLGGSAPPVATPATPGDLPDEAELDALEAQVLGERSHVVQPPRPIEAQIRGEAEQAVQHILLDLARRNIARQYVERIEVQIAVAEADLFAKQRKQQRLIVARDELDLSVAELHRRMEAPSGTLEDQLAKQADVASRFQTRGETRREKQRQINALEYEIKSTMPEQLKDLRADLDAVRAMANAPCPDLSVLHPLYQSVDGWGDPVVPVER